MNSGFLDKLIERISRVRTEEVQGYLPQERLRKETERRGVRSEERLV